MTRSIFLAAIAASALFLHLCVNAPTALYIGNTLVLGDANIQQVLGEIFPFAAASSLAIFVLMISWPKTFLIRRFAGWTTLFVIIGFQFALFLNGDLQSWPMILIIGFMVGLLVTVAVPEAIFRTAVIAGSIFVFFNSAVSTTKAWPELTKKSDTSKPEQFSNPFERPFLPNQPAERFFGTFPVGAPGLNLYSAEKNVVVLIIDTFQNDIAEKLIDWASFDGFTYYRNASSVFPYTGMSLPVIHSGEVYELGEDLAAYFKRADAARVERDLIKNGFVVDHLGLWDRALHTYGSNVAVVLANRALLSAFIERQIPRVIRDTWAKPDNHKDEEATWLTPTDQAEMDLDTFASVIRNMAVGAKEPRFKWLHFWGTHMPTTLNARCETIEITYTATLYEGQANCMLSQVTAYLQALKSAGIYDQTQVFIMADHGTKEIPVNGESSEYPVSWKVRAAAHPMLMFKDFNAHGPISFSDDAVSHRDVKPTILGTGGLKSPSGEDRIFMDYHLASEIEQETLSPTVYTIGEDVRDPRSWAALD